ncbi:MAG: class I SAM-dependent methyltransferase [Aggregatilineales bacterium]
MDDHTAARLNAINQRFYEITAEDFDATRTEAWPGWLRLLPLLRPRTPSRLRILDVGCGNGRFGLFLAERFGGEALHYTGIDSSPALLTKARARLGTVAGIQFDLEQRDLITSGLSAGRYDVVAAFGLLHHLPGAQQRIEFMQQLSARVDAGGMLVFTCWRFMEYERFRARTVDWPDDLMRESGDYLLDWRRGTRALRYCHHIDDDELGVLIAASGMRLLSVYRADGHSRDVNLYCILT